MRKKERKKKHDVQLYHWREEKYVEGFGGDTSEGGEEKSRKNLRLDGMIILKLILTNPIVVHDWIFLAQNTVVRQVVLKEVIERRVP
jgi:hypothetical protein